MEDYYEYLDSNGVTTLYKLIKDDTVALIDSYSVTINGITTNLDNHVNNADIHTPIATIEGMIDTAVGSLNYATPDYVDTKVADLVNSSPETLDTLKELSDALGNDSNFATTVANQIGSKASKDDVYTKEEADTLLESKANSEHSHVVSDITDFPTIPTKTSQLINDSGFLTSSNGLITSVSWSDITNKPNFSTVATSGSYNDLSNKPTIPNVYNKTLTIQKNGTNVATFTSNSNTDVTADITVPTKVSELSNDSGFITGISWDKVTNKPTLATVATSGSYTDLSNTPTIPTKVSQLENDMGFGAGGDTSDCVHKTGNETINGVKTFTQNVNIKNNNSDLTVTPTNNVLSAITFRDKNNKTTAALQNSQRTYGVNDICFYVYDNSSNSHGFRIRTDKTLEPIENNTYSLGSPNNKWTKVYSDDIVHTSGDEIIHGTKIFYNTIGRHSDLTTSGAEQVYNFYDTNANSCGHIYNNVHWHANAVYNRHGAYNAKSGKSMEIDITSNDSGVGMMYASGTARKGNLETATSETGHTGIATMGWVNNPATSTNVVHRSGNETIDGLKTFNFWQIINMGLNVKWITGNKEQKFLNLFASMNDKYEGFGAMLELHGDDGRFALIANDKTNTNVKRLIGFPNGTLTWGGKNLITTTFVKGNTGWYRKHSDGFIEQGGIGNASIMESTNKVTLLTPFSNTNYVVTGSSNFRADVVFGVSSKTTTYFYCGLSQPGITWATGTFSWYACGY